MNIKAMNDFSVKYQLYKQYPSSNIRYVWGDISVLILSLSLNDWELRVMSVLAVLVSVR